MNPIEIAYFKHFMCDKMEQMRFLTMYRKRRFSSHPESFEAFLLNISAKDVIMKAFGFITDNLGTRPSYTYNYWKVVDEDWQQYMSMMEKNHSNERWWDLKGTFSILRQNWDLPNFYSKENIESIEATFKRLGVIVPKQKEEIKPVERQEEKPLITFAEEPDPLAEFEFFEETNQKSRKIKPGEASLNFNNHSYKLTFNATDTELICKSEMQYVRLGKNKAGDICLIFNNIQGANVSKSSHSNRTFNNITINSKDICTKLRTLLNVKLDYSFVNVEKLPSTPDYIIYKITK